MWVLRVFPKRKGKLTTHVHPVLRFNFIFTTNIFILNLSTG